MTTQEFPRDVESLITGLCRDIATPRSLTVKLLIEHGEWSQLAALRVEPKHYLDGRLPHFFGRGFYHGGWRFWLDAVVSSFLRKTKGLPSHEDLDMKAVETFYLCERTCFVANERLSPLLFGASVSDDEPTNEAVLSILRKARKNVRRMLGSSPHCEVFGKFGPGATYGDRGKLSTVPDKMTSRPTLTASALGFLFPWADTAWARACAADGRAPTFVSGNRFTSVPKDSTKNRGIAIEPSLNVFYQLGVGLMMKERLKNVGFNTFREESGTNLGRLDLRAGQGIHRRKACEASSTGAFATIDLSNASDTVCKNLVKLLLPSSWYELLDSLRSPTTLIGGKVVRLEKFSSMGNGFTFELETCIFASLCAAVMETRGHHVEFGENLLVYGDDIIVPSDVASDVLSTLRFFGFTPNGEKSFVSGPFRESCGGDYFEGTDVRPFFLKELPNEPQDYIALANGIRRLAGENHLDPDRFSVLRRTWLRVLDCIPEHIRRLRGPKDLGDLVIHEDDEERWSYRWRHSIRQFRVFRPVRFKRIGWEFFKPDVVLATALYGTGDGELGITPRDAVEGYAVRWVPDLRQADRLSDL